MPCFHYLLIVTWIVLANASSNDYIYVSSTDNIPDVRWTSRIVETKSENHTSDWAIKLQQSETTALRGCLSVENNAVHLFSLTKGLAEDDDDGAPIKVNLKFTLELDADDFDIDFTVGISDLNVATVKVNTDQAEFKSAECFIELPGDLNCPSLEGSNLPFKLDTDLTSGILSLGNNQCLPFILKVTFDEGDVAYFHKRWKSMGFTILSYDDDGQFPVSTTVTDDPKKKTDSNLILYIVIGSFCGIILVAIIGMIIYVIVKNCKKKKARPVVKKKKESPPAVQTIHISTEKPKKDKPPTKIGEKVSKPKPKRPKVVKIPPKAPSPKPPEKSIQKSPDSTNLGSDFLSVQKKPLPSSDTGLTSNAAAEKRSGFSIKESQPEPQSPKKFDHVVPQPPQPPRASLAVKSNNTLLKSASAIVPPKTPSKKVIKEKTEDAKTLATEDNGDQKTSEKDEGGSKKSEGETSDAKAKKTEGETEVEAKKTTEKTETDTKKSEKSTKKSKKEAKDKSSKRTPSESSAKDKSSSSVG